MKITLWPLLLLLLTLKAEALPADDFHMRVSWVKSMKDLFLEIEQKSGKDLLTHDESHFLKKFKLLEEAWADSRYDCFYAGWPSTLVKSGNRRLCQSPINANTDYRKGSCGKNELLCQPLLFGELLCVSFSSKKDKQMAFSKCEAKFQKEYKGSYDFLKNLDRPQSEELKEISRLAASICDKGDKGVQKGTGMCKNLLKKFPDGMKSLNKAWLETFPESPRPRGVPRPMIPSPPPPAPPEEHIHSEECAEVHPHLEQVVKEVNDLQKLVASGDTLYDRLKADFESSAFCDPHKVLNNPYEKPSALLSGKLTRDLYFIDYLSGISNPGSNGQLEEVLQNFGISSATSGFAREAVRKIQSYDIPAQEKATLKAQVKVEIMKDFIDQYKPGMLNDVLKDELAKRNVFTQEDGTVKCPFVGRDAFMKAMAGREEVLRKHGRSLPNKSQITIVDYSRPSHERRMFVIDLKENKVIHNTWVAHGIGGGTAGKDRKGGSPDVSNRPGSLMSSDGFIIATQAAYGNRFGPNVLLKGIDKNNTNIAARAVIIHGWSSPMSEYTLGTPGYDSNKEAYSSPKDAVSELKRVDVKNSSPRELEAAFSRVKSATFMNEFLEPTEGCLGVPETPVGHLDLKGRNKSQLELLREDLPGSLIFNYSGPEMDSNYF